MKDRTAIDTELKKEAKFNASFSPMVMISSPADQPQTPSAKLATPPPPPPQQPQSQSPSTVTTVESIRCDSCGFNEECTAAYIRRVRDRYKGHWVCGLCAEAVKDEVLRSPTRISVEEAFLRHTNFCHQFRSWNPTEDDESEHPISLIGRILRRSLDGSTLQTAARSNSSGSLPAINAVKPPSLVRSGSCFPSLST